MEYGVETRVDPARRTAYRASERAEVLPDLGVERDGAEPSGTSPAPDQGTQVLDAIRLAACQPYVGAIFNFLLFDEPTLAGWQSGAYYADRTPKRSYAAFRQAIAEATSGTVDCARLKGGPPSSDYTPPAPPTDLAAVAQSDWVELTWSADADAVAYELYRDGECIGSTRVKIWTDDTPRPAAVYTVRAVDAAGNLGEPSEPALVDGRPRRS
jgi:hypothetical protein